MQIYTLNNMCCSDFSEIKKTKIDRDVQDHIFSKDSDKVIAWTRFNGHLRVTVETVK